MSPSARINSVALVVLVLALAAPLALGGWYLARNHQWAEDRLSELEPRYARLLGLLSRTTELDKGIADGNALLLRHTFPASQDVSQAGNAAQQRLRDLFTGAGLEVVSSQILPAKGVKEYDRIALSVRVEGQASGLQAAWVALKGISPTIWVEGFTVQTMGQQTATTPPRLSVQLNLYVLRARS